MSAERMVFAFAAIFKGNILARINEPANLYLLSAEPALFES